MWNFTPGELTEFACDQKRALFNLDARIQALTGGFDRWVRIEGLKQTYGDLRRRPLREFLKEVGREWLPENERRQLAFYRRNDALSNILTALRDLGEDVSGYDLPADR